MESFQLTRTALLIGCLFLIASAAQSQPDKLRHKGKRYHYVDSTEVVLFKQSGTYHINTEGDFCKDKAYKKVVEPDTILYLPTYLHEFHHGKATYVYTDSTNNVIAEERIEVSSITKNWLTTFTHEHKMIFHTERLAGLKTRDYDFIIIKQSWHPPKF